MRSNVVSILGLEASLHLRTRDGNHNLHISRFAYGHNSSADLCHCFFLSIHSIRVNVNIGSDFFFFSKGNVWFISTLSGSISMIMLADVFDGNCVIDHQYSAIVYFYLKTEISEKNNIFNWKKILKFAQFFLPKNNFWTKKPIFWQIFTKNWTFTSEKPQKPQKTQKTKKLDNFWTTKPIFWQFFT